MRHLSLGAALAAAATVGDRCYADGSSALPEPGWYELERPPLPGTQRAFYPAALSGDGNVVVGREWHIDSEDGIAVSRAAVWNRGTLSWLAEPARSSYVPAHALAYAVNRDGTIIAGLASLANPENMPVLNAACVWYDGTPLQVRAGSSVLANPVLASGASSDGLVIVGRALTEDQRSVPFRSELGVIEFLEPLLGFTSSATATAVSHDGRIVVGFSQNESGVDEAVRWVDGYAESLGVLPWWASASYATGVNADGTVVVGRIMAGDLAMHFRWQDGQYEVLDGLDPIGPVSTPYARAIAINADGSVIVGGFNERAYYWTSEGGTRPLRTAAIESGIAIPCCTRLLNALDVSDDGKTVLVRGRGRDLVITLGSGYQVPGDVNGDGVVNLADLNLVLANFATPGTDGDANGDGVVDLADLNLVLANFAGGGSMPPEVPGDVNGDGLVDLGDLNLVLANFGASTPDGDANGDGTVDLNDLNVVLANFGA